MKKLGPYGNIFKLTPPVIRRRFYAAFLLVGTVGVLEVFSLSALLAFFTVGLRGVENSRWEALTAWMGAGGLTTSSALLSVALGLFVVKAFFILIVGRHFYHTATAVKRYFQDRLFDRFLHSSFQSQADKRSADWVRSVTADCNALEGRFFTPMLVLLGEIIPALCVCGVLLLVNPTAFLVAIVIFVAVGVLVFFATHRRLVHLGQVQQMADGHIVQSAQHARPAAVAVTDTLLEPVAQGRPVGREGEPSLAFGKMALVQAGFAYDERLVLRSLNVEIVVGDTLAVVGASGSGKSTLINLILGLLLPTQGQVMLNGAPLAGREAQWWTCVGYVPQEPFLMDASAIANVMLGSATHNAGDLARARDLIGLLDLPDALKDASDSIGEGGVRLSGGQRQRLAIARALYRNPQVLILDEATSAMDVHTQARVMGVVAECMKGRTVLMITHRAETLDYCNKILSLPEGRLAHMACDHA